MARFGTDFHNLYLNPKLGLANPSHVWSLPGLFTPTYIGFTIITSKVINIAPFYILPVSACGSTCPEHTIMSMEVHQGQKCHTLDDDSHFMYQSQCHAN